MASSFSLRGTTITASIGASEPTKNKAFLLRFSLIPGTPWSYRNLAPTLKNFGVVRKQSYIADNICHQLQEIQALHHTYFSLYTFYTVKIFKLGYVLCYNKLSDNLNNGISKQ